ncbi:MAG: phosphoglycerate kinase [Gammaproteobacteria bacterium]|nr:phosphoglycerate kinase [Gammaproteobacteria bacterium]MYF61113.1 phosphoglycerate kinase [Gammaproteobacteria bacterium]MYI23430.1 phosphoglycerate kinase [Gammaproteobacteria bacterium]
MRKKTLNHLVAHAGDRIVVRVDFNVPVRNGRVSDDTRIERTLPTLRRLTATGASLVLLSHLGRPGGRPRPEASLRPVAARLGELLGVDVGFSPETTGPEALARAGALAPGEILVAENTRFLAGETRNDPELAAAFAALGRHFVNDAFGTAHRAHASTAGLALAMRARGGDAVAGLLLEREIRFLGDALEDPDCPFVAVLGGAKVSDKIAVIEKMLARADRLLVGGAMANTFFRALGLETGRSLVDEEGVDLAARLMDRAGDRMMLPVDCVVAPRIAPDAATREAPRADVGADDRIGDIGSASRRMFADELERARTIVWNGPMGVSEMPPFAGGTVAVARAAAAATATGAVTIAGGGDSAAAVRAAGLADDFSHVSTGGGASLAFLAGKPLPGVDALSDA